MLKSPKGMPYAASVRCPAHCAAVARAARAPRGSARRAPPRRAPRAADADGPSTSGSGGNGVVYEGVYGPWRVEREDEIEVLW